MLELIHAHEVMHMMLDSGKSYTRESFKADLAEKFGADARFHSCSVNNMSPDDLLEFLAARGKLAGDINAEFSMDPLNMCSH
jgi:probable metal-binding protein